jgi:hypothetical protein
MELMEGKVFYQIFKSTNKDWTTKISDIEIRDALKKKVSFEFIRLTKSKLEKEGILSIENDLIRVNYINSKLY